MPYASFLPRTPSVRPPLNVQPPSAMTAARVIACRTIPMYAGRRGAGFIDYHRALMADTLGVTLSHADVERRRSGMAEPTPLLILALECSRPGALSARWSLA